ncbi:Transmembrane protein 44 [Labeo rohita]|uniref:Transmembrane protein 44 n=1 Tax=Labeo rohita TaxID=84645 RepID=A0ABQ8M8K2_LABRO|nr:Transmembrane protein 44 [Labeo rohita]
MERITVLGIVHRWSPEFVKGCLSTYEEHICISAALYVLSALILLVSCSLLLYHRCKTRGKSLGDEAACALYCFVGNLCSAVGAFLSKQFDFQISMASYMAILDVVHFLEENENAVQEAAAEFSSCVSAVCNGWQCLPGFTSPFKSNKGIFNHEETARHDHTENLGYVLGLLSFAISWTAKFPFLDLCMALPFFFMTHSSDLLSKPCHGYSLLSAVQFWIFLYPLSNSGSGKTAFNIPVFSIVFLICYRSNHKRPSVRSLDSDTESLLGDSSVSGQLCNNNVCLKEVTISRDGSSENLPLKRTVRVVRVDEQCSSGTSTDSSSLGSELEWDFEETKPPWIPVEEAPESLQKAEAFPLQELPGGSISKSTGRPGSHVCLCNRAQLAEKFQSTQSDK